MAMRVPVVAPDMPEMHELVTPETGVLVSPRADPEAYAQAILALAGDPVRREAIGAAARERVRSGFSVTRMAATTGRCTSSCWKHSPPRSRLRRRPRSPGQASRDVRPRRPPGVGRRDLLQPRAYLRECLDSVECRRIGPIETIVVDDASERA